MLILNKAFFFHIPKTAGTSIESVFGGCPNKYQTSFQKSQFSINYQHAFPSEINTKFPSFCFVRNPWDRIVSLFFHFKTGGFLPADFCFSNFVFSVNNETLASKFIKRPSRKERMAKMCLPYSFWLSKNIAVGKFENLQEDFNTICDKIGIGRKTLPHIGETKHQHYTEYYNDETIEIIGKKYAKDIEYFGYEFGK